VTASWTIREFLRDLGERGQHSAIIAFHEDGIETWESATLAGRALGLARALSEDGADGGPVALWAPNSALWVVAALAVLAAGRVLVPIDDLAEAGQLETALASSGARLILTTAHHRDSLSAHRARILLLEGFDVGAASAPGGKAASELQEPAAEAPAVLFWTSGTTGAPKAFFLRHRNIAANVDALRELALVGPHDRALLPLPLHHAYPFVVGMLGTLSQGTAVVLPASATGPALLRALHDGDVTTVIGVPRLYEALLAAILSRIAARSLALRLAWRGLLGLLILVRRRTGIGLGRFLLAFVRRSIAPRLRLLVSGGARLEPETEERLEALGWTVLSGYGLAETASLFSGNRPGVRRFGSAGRPLADGEIRIAGPDEQGIGEIELRGRSVTSGYLGDPEANRAAFTPDGWFRTGDLGFVDSDGFLFVTGRTKEILVLGGGKKVVDPEHLERLYGRAPEIAEIALLEHAGGLVALVRPDAARLRDKGATDLRDGVRIVLGEAAQDLPSYQRLSGFALTDRPLPRTRLGKYRRFLLPALYAEATAGAAGRAAHPALPEDAALLADPTAEAVWNLLRQRYPERMVDLDVNLGLDLNLDSFAWMELAVTLQERFAVPLSESDIADLATVRDLLRLAVERHARLRPAPAEAVAIEPWLAPPGALLSALGLALYRLNRLAMRSLFRLRVAGSGNLPAAGAFVIVANHVSDLDGMIVAASLPLSCSRRLYWAGDLARLFSNPLARLFCRAVHVFPVDARRPGAALDAACRVLEAGNILAWFPEAWRSPDGKLQRFLPGIGQLLLRTGVPAVPAFVAGAFEALPRGRHIPRLRRLTLAFGAAAPAALLCAAGTGRSDEERIADGLRQRIVALGAASGEGGIAVLSAADRGASASEAPGATGPRHVARR
jgi:long-chain acyl-CoA synthetase